MNLQQKTNCGPRSLSKITEGLFRATFVPTTPTTNLRALTPHSSQALYAISGCMESFPQEMGVHGALSATFRPYMHGMCGCVYLLCAAVFLWLYRNGSAAICAQQRCVLGVSDDEFGRSFPPDFRYYRR
jgi:hypothetical protein